MTAMQNRFFRLFVSALIVAGASVARAEDPVNTAEFSIALSGLPIARAEFITTLRDKRYEVSATLRTTGLARFITNTRARIKVDGLAGRKSWRPRDFSFHYDYGRRSRSFQTRFLHDQVTSSTITPKPDYSKRKNWVPTRPEDLRNVTDPVTALIVPAASEPCRAMVGVFDGEARMNLRLSPKRTDRFKAAGYDGEVTVCSIRYEPVSGHRRKSKDIDYIKQLANIEIWFAKSAKLDVYAPVYLAVPTKYGVISITATRFEG
ncbi:DUF3108 domain-containing protein [Rhizobium sp. G21]|nr:DUF3108 domain-containing protein [Rhizobium sp. G21]